MIRPTLTTTALAFAVAACGNPAPPADPQPTSTAQAPGEASTPAAPAAPPAGPIPLAYRHVWAIDPADCTKQPGLTRISIAPDAISFYEGRAVVKKAQVEGPNKLLLDVDHTAEGEIRPERHAFALSNAGSRLLYQRGRDSLNYVRCD